MKPRILHISARADHSGGPRHLFDLLSGGLLERAEVYVACPRERPFWDRYASLLGHQRLIEIPHRRLSAAAFMGLRRAVRAHGVQLVHSHGRGAGWYARLIAAASGIPAVHTFHGLQAGVSPLRRLEERILGSWTTRFIAVSQTEAERARLLLRLDESGRKLVVIPNAVVVPPAMPGSQSPVAQVVGVMRLVAEKQPGLFVDIAHRLKAQHPLVEWRLAGDGPLHEGLLKSSAGSVQLLGAIDSTRDLLSSAPSIYLATAPMEGMSIALLDAMAMGVPVVASRVPGNIDVISDGETGLLYSYGDVTGAASAVARLIENAELRQRLVRQAYEYILAFHSLPLALERLSDLYEEVLKTGSRKNEPNPP